MIELYDIGKTTHRRIPGVYEFIEQNAHRYVEPQLAERLAQEARLREEKGHSIPQELFTVMNQIWVEAYQRGELPVDLEAILCPDTIPRFKRVKKAGRDIGILTSCSPEFTEILYSLPVADGKLSDYIDSYFLGEEIGDKDFPETFERLWHQTNGQISAVFDDKSTVCRAAHEGFQRAGGSAKIYLVDRKGESSPEQVKELEQPGIRRIGSFNEAE